MESENRLSPGCVPPRPAHTPQRTDPVLFVASKTLLMLATEPAFRARVNVSAVSVHCRFWVSTEARGATAARHLWVMVFTHLPDGLSVGWVWRIGGSNRDVNV